MKNRVPVYLSISILVGSLVFIFVSNFLLSSIVKFDPEAKGDKHGIELVLRNHSSVDTLKVSPMVKTGIELNKEGYFHIKNELYTNTYPDVLNWILFHSVALSSASAAMMFLIFLIYTIKKNFKIKLFGKKSFKEVLPILLVIPIAGLFLYLIGKEQSGLMGGVKFMELYQIIFNEPTKIVKTILIIYFAIGTVPLTGILFVNLGIRNAFQEVIAPDEEIWQKKYKELKDKLNVFALFSGLLVGASIISTRLQRNMIAAQVENIEKIFPDDFIYGYGLSYSLILAFFFIPCLAYLKYFKQQKGFSTSEKEETTSWWKLGQEAIDDTKLLFSIALPFISSFVQSFISA